MATATIKLYYGTALKPWKLTANKFFAIDDISVYLATFTPTTINNVQYQKCELEMSMILDMSQLYAQPLYSNGIKYVSIKNSDETKTYYYFVKKAEWRALKSVRLVLVMDVINTYQIGTDYDFTSKTKIIREHKDRFKLYKVNKFYFTSEVKLAYNTSFVEGDEAIIRLYNTDSVELLNFRVSISTITSILGVTRYDTFVETIDITALKNLNVDNVSVIRIEDIHDNTLFEAWAKGRIFNFDSLYERLIDLQSEGLTPVLYKKYQNIINRNGILNKSWYLLYRNQNDPDESLINPVECYLIPETQTECNLGSVDSVGRIDPTNLELGKFYVIPLYYHQTMTINLPGGITLAWDGVSENPYAIIERVSDTSILVYAFSYAAGIHVYNTYVAPYVNLSSLPCMYDVLNSFYQYERAAYEAHAFPYNWNSTGYSPFFIDGITQLDRTDAKNIKLIKLPYIPSDIDVIGDKLILTDSDWTHMTLTQSNGSDIEVLKLQDLNIKFDYSFFSDLTPFEPLIFSENAFHTLGVARDNGYESKIYHSDYYQPKVVYDSFGYVFQLEREDLDYYETIDDKSVFEIRYVVTSTINSRMMFQFPEFVSYVGKEDYDNVMPIARNNELTLYNVPYINYIRTGYNYDVKNKNMQAASTWTSVGLGAVSAASSLLLPGVPLKVAGVVASLVSTAISVKGAIVSQVQAERSLDEKMLSYKNQSTSISGSDDVDLMSAYTQNRAKFCLYEVSDVIKDLLYNLFYYTGYVSNKMGVPVLNTRTYFNYIEADIVITDYANMSEEIMNELVGLYKNGVTFIHHVGNAWDLDQQFENWEKSL